MQTRSSQYFAPLMGEK